MSQRTRYYPFRSHGISSRNERLLCIKLQKSLDYSGVVYKLASVLRDLIEPVNTDLDRKIILITGPRQSGKTTLSRMLSSDYEYFNYDLAEHRLLLQEKSWDRQKQLIIFDELHKMKAWKAWLKGIYDVEGLPPSLIVTGSAKLSAFRKTGDSLAGRHFVFRLHPITFAEACRYTDLSEDEILRRLMEVSGFPEPFLNGKKVYYNRWKRSHIDLILKEDLLSLTAVRDIQTIETLIELLRSKIGSPVSTHALANDLQKSPKTIKAWLELLENLYVIFRLMPYHKNIARSLLKQPKFYFYDNAMVKGDQGIKLENLVATSLLKEVHFQQDVLGEDYSLSYIRNKDGYEIDFLIQKAEQPYHLIEVKWKDDQLSRNFKKFFTEDLGVRKTQVVADSKREKTFPTGEEIRDVKNFLKKSIGDKV